MSSHLIERQAAASLTANHHRSMGPSPMQCPAPMDLRDAQPPDAMGGDAARLAQASRASQATQAFRPALTAAGWRTFASFCVSRRLEAGSRVLVAGHPDRALRFVMEGCLWQARVPVQPGAMSRSNLLLPGCMFGEDALFADGPGDFDVCALEDSRVLELSWQRRNELSTACPEIAFELLRAGGAVIAARRVASDLRRTPAASAN